MMECFDLQALPFDVLILVFQFLDSRSLFTACLTSKSLREIATPLLYENVQLGPSPRCERYDLLSNITLIDLCAWPGERFRNVRHLDTWSCYHENHEDQREKLGELVNVSSLRCPDDQHWCHWKQYELIGCVINRLPPLRVLDLDTVPSGIRNGQLRHLETLRVSAVDDWSWLLRETTASLKFLYFMDSLDYNTCLHIAKLTNLVSLFIDDIDMPMDDIMSSLAMLSNLTRLETLHLYNTTCVDILPSATGLVKLRDVTLKFKWEGAGRALADAACFLDSVAGSSRLHRLKVEFIMWDLVQFRGENFIAGILEKHSDTLNVLRLPQFHPPKGIYARIFSCLKLKKLSIGVTSLLLNHLPALLAHATTLERLSLMPAYHHARLRSTHVRQLLCQGTSLRSIKLCILKRCLGIRCRGVMKLEWKAEWVYSAEFQCVRRIITGPGYYTDPRL